MDTTLTAGPGIPPGLEAYFRMFQKLAGRDPNTVEIEHELTRRQQAPYASVAPINQPAAMREPSLHEQMTPAERRVMIRLNDPELFGAGVTRGDQARVAAKRYGEGALGGARGVADFFLTPLHLLGAATEGIFGPPPLTKQQRAEQPFARPTPGPTVGQIVSGLNPLTQAKAMLSEPDAFRFLGGQAGMVGAGELAGLGIGEALRGPAPVAPPPVDWQRVFTPQLAHSAAAPGIIDARASEIGRRLLDHVSEPAEATYEGLVRRRLERLVPPGYEPRRAADAYTPTERTQVAATIAQNIEGATLVPLGKTPTTQAGFAVADPQLTLQLNPTENLNAAIQRWITRMDVQRALREPGAHVGTWRDPETGQAEVNVTGLLPDEAQARMLGGARGEKAIGELGPGGEYLRSIQLPGSAVTSYEPRSTALVSTRPPEPPTPPAPPSNIIAQGLSKDDAVAQMKRLSAAGQRAQMRPGPDGLYSLVRKNAPQKVGETLMKPAPKEIARVGPSGQANDAGFQSRLETTVAQGDWPEEGMTPQEWYNRLKNNPHVPKSELDIVMEPLLYKQTPRGFDVFAGNGKHLDYISQGGSAEEVRQGLIKHDGYTHNIVVRPAGSVRHLGADVEGRITAEALQHHIQETSPVAKLTTDVRSNEGGAEITDAMIYQEVEYQQEQWEEDRKTRHQDMLEDRNRHLENARSRLIDMFGREGGNATWRKLADELLPEGDLVPHYDSETGTWGKALRDWQTRDFRDWDSEDLKDYDPKMPDDVYDAIAALRSDPAQLPLTKAGRRGPVSLKNALRGEPTEEQMTKLEQDFVEANDSQRIAVSVLLEEPDYDMLREDAVRNLEENGNFQHGGDEGDTKYANYQRVDPSAPYREILVQNPDLQRPEGAHKYWGLDDLQAHARMEIHHGDTGLLIEAQSAVGQFVNQHKSELASAEDLAAKNPFIPTERWAQLAVAAAVKQAAEEGLDGFAWVTPEDRQHKASLDEESAEITYGHAVPKGIERIWKWLDEPIEVNHAWKSNTGEKFPRIKLTRKMRRKITEAGVNALGIAALSLGAAASSEDARRDRLAAKIRGK